MPRRVLCRRCLPAVLFLVIAWGGETGAQESQRVEERPDSLMRYNGASVLFDRNLNTYNWIGRLFVDTSGSFGSLAARAQHAVNIIRLEPSGARRLLQSTQTVIGVQGAKPLGRAMELRARWSSLLYEDDKSVGLNSSAGHTVLAGFGFTPLPVLELSGLAGGRWDRQVGITDRGVSVDILGLARGADLDGYRIDGTLRYRQDWVAPRRLGDQTARVSVQKEFAPGTRDSLDVGYMRTRREFYSPADSAIESRVENTVAIANQLQYGIDRSLSALLYTGFA